MYRVFNPISGRVEPCGIQKADSTKLFMDGAHGSSVLDSAFAQNIAGSAFLCRTELSDSTIAFTILANAGFSASYWTVLHPKILQSCKLLSSPYFNSGSIGGKGKFTGSKTSRIQEENICRFVLLDHQ